MSVSVRAGKRTSIDALCQCRVAVWGHLRVYHMPHLARERERGRRQLVPTPLACSMSVSSPAKLRNGMTADQTYKRRDRDLPHTQLTRDATPQWREEQRKVKRTQFCVWVENNSTQFMWLHLDYKIDKLTMSGAETSQVESRRAQCGVKRGVIIV